MAFLKILGSMNKNKNEIFLKRNVNTAVDDFSNFESSPKFEVKIIIFVSRKKK